MNPRLKSAPLTDDDRAAWFDWQVNRNRDWLLWGALERSFESDRRDADIMLQLGEYNERGLAVWLRIGAENFCVPGIHVLLRRNPLWPSS